MMKYFYYTFLLAFLSAAIVGCSSHKTTDLNEERSVEAREREEEDEEHDGYDEAAARDRFEFERIKDPALGYIPSERMMKAVDYTENLKSLQATSRVQALNWIERGPVYDSTGPSNGNQRGSVPNAPGTYTAGRTAAVLIDTLNDPTGNTVFCGGIAGGMWKCTNFLSGIPNWTANDDRFDNLAISYICQDPSNPAIMYFSTGEATSNADAVYGGGVYRSTNAGTTWTKLPGTANNIRNFKVVCDAQGNVYLASRITTFPLVNNAGLLRSKDQGNTWENITPANLTSSNAHCTDIEVTSTGKLNASFGYTTSGTTNKIQHVYTTTPATVTSATWSNSTGIRNSGLYSLRLEMTSLADTMYAATVNSAANVDSFYKSIDGGATWTKQNTTAPPTGILSGQGWYNITMSINPSNAAEFIIGGLDAYRSTNSGLTATSRVTFWVGSGTPYVHADHHFMQWWRVGNQSRIVIGGDGGIYVSNDAGATFTDKNRNLAIKQFYDGAIHPAQGSNYLLAGAQDNGTHQLKNAGLSYSTEVTGGDGAFVHINQQNPKIQFSSYVFNQYRRSVDGGATWQPINFSNSAGLFINPYDYDDGQNIMYATYGSRSILRWKDANTSSSANTLTISSLVTRGSGTSNTPTAFRVSPYTKDRVFIGGSKGAITRLDNASTVTTSTVNANTTDITGSDFDSGYVSCVNTGTSDNFLVATFSSYGVKHVFVSNNAGVSWTNIDGTPGSGGLPDVPVRWAVFDPQNNNRLFIATEVGVYSTDNANGANTVWAAETTFPTVRTDALQIRLSDNTMLAATHGRGLFTAVIPSIPEVRFSAGFASYAEARSDSSGARRFTDYPVDVSIISAPTGNATVTYSLQGGNTALEGLDFEFTTNGDFTNPSKQHVFNNGVIGVKTLTIRVYDDAEIEGPESLGITFNVSGSTNAFAGSANIYNITINDNDFAPVGYVGNGTFSPDTVSGVSGSVSPFKSDRFKHKLHNLYTAAELKAAGILAAGNITALKLKVTSKNSTRPYAGFTIAMANSSSTNLSSGYGSGDFTTVWSGDYSTVLGDNDFTFTTPFAWDGFSNVLVQYCFDNGAQATAETKADTMQVYTVSSAYYSSVYSNTTTNSTTAGCSLGAANISFARITATFTATFGTPIASALNSTSTEYFNTGAATDPFNFYTNSGSLLAVFKNTSMFNYGNTSVVIDRAGTSVKKFYNDTDSSMYIMEKTFTVTPTFNNSIGAYEATFYFTKAEKEGWETATKQSFDNIRMIKTAGPISSVTPANPNGAGNVEIVVPTSIGIVGTNTYFITANFNSGFSGFGFGLPFGTLPVTLLDFAGKLQGDDALLSWSTSTEQNTKSFELQKSTDGVNYRNIGQVAAAGNSTTKRTYSFVDKDFASATNYYRLNMVDNDNKGKLSNVVVLRNAKNKQSIVVVNNPFKDVIRLRFSQVPQGRLVLQLSDNSGRVVLRQTFNNLAQNMVDFNVRSNVLSGGVYVLSAQLEGQRYAMKVMKQ